MSSRFLRTLTVSALFVALFVPTVHSDEIARKGRKILEDHQDSVVTLTLVLKQKVSFPGMASQESESTTEATGTIISPDGLVVLSLSATDPSSLVEAMMAGSGRGRDLKMETEVRDIKILLKDGSEISAKVILRDQDLDMAFVRPVEVPETPFAYIDISKSGAPDYLDQIVTLNRLGKVANRVHSASLERIEAIVTKPRTFYIPGNDPTNTGLGSPAFTLDGKFIGVFLMRAIKATGGGGRFGGFGGGSGDNIASVVVPAEDIAYAAEQVPPFED